MDIDAFVDKVEQLARNDEFSGAITLSQKEQILFRKAYGYACKAFKIPNKVDTKFNIASVGKVFTGVAIAQLVQNGKVNFNDAISKYIGEDWIQKSISHEVTIEHLLTHTSGFGDYFPCAYDQSYRKTFEQNKDFQEIIYGSSLSFRPGTSWCYSNTGFLILGLIIETVAQMEYGRYISSQIFARAGMENSGFYFIDEPVENRATGYYRHNDTWRCNTIKPVVRGTGAGGCYSSATDLTRFIRALLSGELLNDTIADIVLSPKPDVNSPNYGYGFFIKGNKIFHTGDGTGISANLAYYKDRNCVLAVLSNYGSPTAGQISALFEDSI